jgi:hypothetical protein
VSTWIIIQFIITAFALYADTKLAKKNPEASWIKKYWRTTIGFSCIALSGFALGIEKYYIGVN